LPVGLVAVTAYREGSSWRPQALTPGQAVLAMLRETLSAQFDPEGAMGVLTRAVRSALLFRGNRGEADETAERLIAALDEQERRPCYPRPGESG
jgi:hypothetical protein